MPGREREGEMRQRQAGGSAHRYIWLLPVACVAPLPPRPSPGKRPTTRERARRERQEKKIAPLELV